MPARERRTSSWQNTIAGQLVPLSLVICRASRRHSKHACTLTMNVDALPMTIDLSVVPATVPNHIGNLDTMAAGGQSFTKKNPATGRALCEVTRSNRADVDLAVKKAKAAQPAWAATTVVKRGDVLRQVALLMREHREEIATLVAKETGKSKKDARSEERRVGKGG